MKRSVNTNRYTDVCLEAMKSQGLRITATRRVAAEAIEGLGAAFTAKSLHEYIERDLGTKFDFATLYRTVQTFESLGLVHADTRTGGYMPCTHLGCDDFIHVIYSCTDCRQSFEDHLPRKVAERVSQAITGHQGFQASSSVMQVKGVCEPCRG